MNTPLIFEFKEYNEENLAEALSTDLYPPIVVKTKNQFLYLLDYFKESSSDEDEAGLGVSTILIEPIYYSQSYAQDFQNFHVLTHGAYKKTCKRVHFFQEPKPANIESDSEIFFRHNEAQIKIFWDSYIGYIVVRPIPTGLVGATILSTYPQFSKKGHERVFPATMPYKINIFGVQKTVYSLIYQEQDALSGACATTSLWCAFYKLNHLFRTPILSPSSITLAAGNSSQHSDRLMPNTGLDLIQMRNAINHIGLEAEIRNSDEIENIRWVRGMVYSYLRLGIPVILGIKFKNKSNAHKSSYHALTIVGYQDIKETQLDHFYNRILILLQRLVQKTRQGLKISDSTILLKGEMISKFYAHDDQIGPFSRLIFLSKNRIKTSWWDSNDFYNTSKKEIGFFESLIIPIPKEFRIYYTNVREQVTILNGLLVNYFNYPDNIYWNIYLEQSNLYKHKILTGNSVIPHSQNIVFINLPKYLWIAELYDGKEKVFDYILDPTEINNSHSGLAFVYYNNDDYEVDSNHVKQYFENFKRIFEYHLSNSPDRHIKRYSRSVLKVFLLFAKNLIENSTKS